LKKFLFIPLMFAGVLAFTQNAHAQCDRLSCATSITVDSGNTAYTCNNTGWSCSCAGIAFHQGRFHTGGCDDLEQVSNPGSGWSGYGGLTDGTNCWVQCYDPPGQVTPPRESEPSNDENLSEAFTPFTGNYFGWADTVMRSPNDGRANSIHARLDACLNYTDVDTITASGWTLSGEQGCESNCGLGNVNEYCNANTAAVCKDRCACLYKYNNAGLTSLTCNNL
jgi:hypothetical protein